MVFFFFLIKKNETKGVLENWLSGLIALASVLAEDSNLGANTHIRQLTTASSTGSDSLCWPLWAPALRWYTFTHASTHINKKETRVEER